MSRTEEWRDWSCAVAVNATSAPDLAPAVAIVRSVMAEVEASASRFRADSDLSRINAAAGRYALVRPTTVHLVQLALAAAVRTAGAVTPTVGAALLAQGYDEDIDVVRARSAHAAPVPVPAPDASGAVRVDAELGRVGVTPGTVLDLGALAKAYAVDEAIARIGRAGLGPVLVSIGGDLATHGEETWQIAVSETAEAPAQLVDIDGGALATSSSVGRRWAGDRHHLIDPRTGRCATGPWRTATVWAPTAVEANLLSTWALVDAGSAARALADDTRPTRLAAAGGEVVAWHGWPAGSGPEQPQEQAS